MTVDLAAELRARLDRTAGFVALSPDLLERVVTALSGEVERRRQGHLELVAQRRRERLGKRGAP